MHRYQPFSSGGNPSGNFNPLSTNTMNNLNNNSFYNFNNGFAQNNPMIEKADFKNKNNMIHNNMGDNLLSEHIAEYQLHLDSNDRTMTTYQNPFKFIVSFGGSSGKKTVKKKYRVKTPDGKDIYDYYEDFTTEGTPAPIIGREFKNVKYIKLDYLIMPRTIYLTKDVSGTYQKTDSAPLNLTRYKYLIVKIKELGSGRIVSTNNVIGDDSFLVYPDKFLGVDNVLWVTSYGSRIYTNSNLGNITRLSIYILDPNGNQLCIIDHDTSKEIDMSVIVTGSTKYTEDELNSLKLLNPELQCNLSFLMGVVEGELNTVTKYET
jgi:hypothetical protein